MDIPPPRKGRYRSSLSLLPHVLVVSTLLLLLMRGTLMLALPAEFGRKSNLESEAHQVSTQAINSMMHLELSESVSPLPSYGIRNPDQEQLPVPVQVFVVTSPSKQEYRERFLANAAGWHRHFQDLQVYSFDQGAQNMMAGRTVQVIHHDPAYETNAQRSNLLMASFWAIYQYNPSSDWYLLAEDDTIVVPSNLRQLLQLLNSSSDVYTGRCVIAQRSKRFGQLTFVMGGAGILMSRTLLAKLVPHIPSCRQDLAKFQHGDTRIAACPKRNNLIPENMCVLGSLPYKFTSASPWFEATKNRHAIVTTMHEKNATRIALLNGAVHELEQRRTPITWGSLLPYLLNQTFHT